MRYRTPSKQSEPSIWVPGVILCIAASSPCIGRRTQICSLPENRITVSGMPCWMESAMLLQRASRMRGKPAVAMGPAVSQSWTQQHHLRASAGVLKYAHCQKTGSLSQECHAGWNQQCSCRELLECVASLQLQWGLQYLSLGHSSIISVHRQAYSNMLTARKQDHCLRNAMLDGISNALAESF